MLPPSHAVYLRCGGATICTCTSSVVSARSSFSSLASSPSNSVLLPASTIFAYISARRSASQRARAAAHMSWIPCSLEPTSEGSNSSSGARNRSAPTLIVRPSGSLTAALVAFALTSSAAKSVATYASWSRMPCTASTSSAVVSEWPASLSSRVRYSVTERPLRSLRTIACGRAYPSCTGTAKVTPSFELSTSPLVRPAAYSASTA
mmetsp:Transcript_16250/g.42085  ORF Transcript_16250/g.42085 Transcript_16250/m.42085 type:complete len:206 (-) Transcript_16250:276-893(-)